jgi:predicted phosphate transport protein (TIGR00153 family)
MLRWFSVLMPREGQFFELFAKHADTIVAGAKALRSMLEGGESVSGYCKTVMDREKDADNLTREVLVAVRRTFITPFDRGDVKDLITSMDDTIDQMQKTAKAIMLFDIRTFTPQMRDMGDAIVAAAVLVQEAVPLLSSINAHAARISAICEQLSQLEGQTDEFHDIGLKELYQGSLPSNAMTFFAAAEVYDHLEKVVDRFDDVGNEINGIMLENV